MPIPSRWRWFSVVLPLLFSAAPLLAPAPLLARASETAAVLEAIDSGTVSRGAVEALLVLANAGDAEAAEVAGRLYDRGIGVKWDPPSALRWYTAAALSGSDSAKREAVRLWRVMPPVSQRRAEAVLAHFFTDAELAGIGLGPVRRPTVQRSWMTHLEAAGFLAPPPPASAPVAAPAATLAPVPAPVSLPAPVQAPTSSPKPAVPQLVSAVAALPSASPAPIQTPAAPTAAEAEIPRPPHKPHQKNAAKAHKLLPVAHTPMPAAKPKR